MSNAHALAFKSFLRVKARVLSKIVGKIRQQSVKLRMSGIKRIIALAQVGYELIISEFWEECDARFLPSDQNGNIPIPVFSPCLKNAYLFS